MGLRSTRQPVRLDDMPDVLTVAQVQSVLAPLGRNHVYRLMADGTLPSLRFGKRLVIYRAALQRFLENGDAGGQA